MESAKRGVVSIEKEERLTSLKVKYEQKRVNKRIPYRTKLSRTKVMKFWLGDENVRPNAIQKVNIDKRDENLA